MPCNEDASVALACRKGDEFIHFVVSNHVRSAARQRATRGAPPGTPRQIL